MGENVFFDEKVFDFVNRGFCDNFEFFFWNGVIFCGNIF